MSRKITGLLTALVMSAALAISGCQGTSSGYTYAQAQEKTAALTSANADIAMHVELPKELMEASGLNVNGSSVNVSSADIVLQPKIENLHSDDPIRMEMPITLSSSGVTLTFNSYEKDKTAYMSFMGEQAQQPVSDDKFTDALEAVLDGTAFAEKDLKDVKADTKNDTTTITYNMNGDALSTSMTNIFTGLLSFLQGSDATVSASSREMFEKMSITCDDTDGTLTVNKDGFAKTREMDIKSRITVEGVSVDFPIDLTVTYINPGETVKANLPADLDSYPKDDMGTFGDSTTEDGSDQKDSSLIADADKAAEDADSAADSTKTDSAASGADSTKNDSTAAGTDSTKNDSAAADTDSTKGDSATASTDSTKGDSATDGTADAKGDGTEADQAVASELTGEWPLLALEQSGVRVNVADYAAQSDGALPDELNMSLSIGADNSVTMSSAGNTVAGTISGSDGQYTLDFAGSTYTATVDGNEMQMEIEGVTFIFARSDAAA